MSARQLFQRGRTAAIIVGASIWEQDSLAGGTPFATSASLFRAYLTDKATLNLDINGHVLDLFNNTANQLSQIEEIGRFLRERADTLSDVVFYYVGHGSFTTDRKFAVLVRSSRTRDSSKLRMSDVSETLREDAPHARLIVILDCCYSGEASKDFMSAHDNPAIISIEGGLSRAHENVPESVRGTLVYCSSSPMDVSSAGMGGDRTMFTGALMDVLSSPSASGKPHISFRELNSQILRSLRKSYGDAAVIPQLQQTEQAGTDLLQAPAFPVKRGGRKDPVASAMRKIVADFRETEHSIMSFERIREHCGTSWSDSFLERVIRKYPKKFRLATIRGGDPGIGIL